MDKVIRIEIPCWNCGKNMGGDLRIFDDRTAYWYCHTCKAGFEITFYNNILKFNTLSFEG